MDARGRQHSLFLAVCIALSVDVVLSADEPAIGSYDPNWGVYIGKFSNLAGGEIQGSVYAVNETCLQVRDFSYNGEAPDMYFWLDKDEKPSRRSGTGVKLPTFEYGIGSLGVYKSVPRVVLNLPGRHRVSSFRSLSLYCYQYDHNFGTVLLPTNLEVPKPQFLNGELHGSRYSVGSGPILIADRRTFKMFGFTYDGDKAPDAFFFAGKGASVNANNGVKLSIRGHESSLEILPIREKYRGGRDLLLELPSDQDIAQLDWLAVYCPKFRVDFGRVSVTNITQKLPPWVPLQKTIDDLPAGVVAWEVRRLLGTDERKNFTFQLGPPGGVKGWQAMSHARPARSVWYINGQLAELWLRRGVTYTFIVEGGKENALHITDDVYGGYAKQTDEEKKQVKTFAGGEASAGRLCEWQAVESGNSADSYDSFTDFRRELDLACESGRPAIFKWTPDEHTPDLLFAQSYSTFNAGSRVRVVDDLSPADVTADRLLLEEPYQYDVWIRSQATRRSTSATSSVSLHLSLFTFVTCALLLQLIAR